VTLVDTNVFVDLWTSDPSFGAWSERALARAAGRGPLAINPVIYAELCLGFREEAELERILLDSGVRRLQLPYPAAWPAAKAFDVYRKRGGTRITPLPDFFIGAHALVENLPLLTRDAARYRTYFPDVRLIAPAPGR
jgi:predicted nucleic acid-binding protein